MESSLVIKVKHGDTLRRISTRVDEEEKLELDMARLQEKIRSLFDINPDANFTLKYIDEDGDLVTLVNDDDLLDVMRQRLKFLRIEVHMNNDQAGRSYQRSSGSSTPLRSPQAQDLGNSGFADALMSLPEPVRGVIFNSPLCEVISKAPVLEAMSNISSDLKSASFSPVAAEILKCILKMGQSFLNDDSQHQAGQAVNANNTGVSGNPLTPAAADPKPTCLASSKISERDNTDNVNRGVGVPAAAVSASVDNFLPCDQNPSQGTDVDLAPFVSKETAVVTKEETKMQKNDKCKGKAANRGASWCSAAPSYSPVRATGLGASPSIECPFSGMPVLDSAPTSFGNYRIPPFKIPPFKRSHSHTETMGGMFHKGVRCDGCGVYPITGPRFKSKVKENYDLCNICYNVMGKETDFIRLDRPVSSRHTRSVNSDNCPWTGGNIILPQPPLIRGCKLLRPKFDSRFILDVNVLDGTMMAPCTPFTKIWRMRNNGTLVWPQGTQLIWIGGDKFTEALSVEIEIPEDGIPMEKELDIAVDFRAPESPGRYISYWRMASPSGQKFGQRVWVLIQVDASLKESFCDSFLRLNLNFPPDMNNSEYPEILDMNVQPWESMSHQPANSAVPIESVVQQPMDKHAEEEMGKIEEELSVGCDPSAPAISVTPSSTVSYPIIDLSENIPAPASASEVQPSVADAQTSSQSGASPLEETLLKELEEMGFKQVDLNKEILRINEYNLEQSVDDLCGVAEWDPILDELKEMGFVDNEMNKKLLKKNNGSIKRVVLDLLRGERKE